MRFSFALTYSLTKYLLKNRISGRKRFPFVLMLEPLHKCNLSCDGCGRIIEYKDTIEKIMSFDECIKSVKECDSPVVTVTGGEPLLYPEIDKLVSEILKMKKFVYLCTNGILLEENLAKLKPSKFLSINIHIDGLEKRHDMLMGREGVFKMAIEGIKKARALGFNICTNTTIYKDTDLNEIQELFALLQNSGVSGMLISPAFSYEVISDNIFLAREEIIKKFSEFIPLVKKFRIMSTPIYLKFLSGKKKLECTPWGNPTRNVRGWKSPCYLLTDRHYETYKDFMEKTLWEKYGTGNDPRCKNCMMHSGFEPSVVIESGKNLKDGLEMFIWNFS